MTHEKRHTKPKKTREVDQTPDDEVERLITEAEDKHIEDKHIKDEGDPLGANFA